MDIWSSIKNFINDASNKIFQAILVLLPDSPFKDFSFPPEIESFLGYLNYYVPFSSLVTIALAWVTCVSIYYGYQLVLRLINAVK